MIRRPPRSTQSRSSAASDVYKRQPLARAMLPAVSLLFLGCAFYGVPYLRLRAERPNRVFVASFLTALGLMSAAHMARHLGVLWIATEALTLSSVPLLHFNNTPRAFEATWKYLL